MGMTGRGPARFLLGLALLVWSAVLALYGVFAVVYDADGGGDTYVEIYGRESDADVVGAIALALSVAAILAALLVLRRSARGG
jgi:hypothetical protein